MIVACLDLEGVLVPEVWIKVAERTGIAALRRTTRDEPDYDALMRARLEILARHGLGIREIQAVIESLEPLPGAREFLDALREKFQVIVVSDTFYAFATPLVRKLGFPTLFCNDLEIARDGRVTGYRLRLPDQKRAAVLHLHELRFRVVACGDSYNDTSMLGAADRGILFRPPPNVVAEFPHYPVVETYAELARAFRDAAEALEPASGLR